MITAIQLVKVYGTASAGNSVLNAQMVSNGPRITIRIRKATMLRTVNTVFIGYVP